MTAGEATLVFVERQATIQTVGKDPGSGAERRTLELNYQTPEGTGVMALVPLEVSDAAVDSNLGELEAWPRGGPLGFPVEPRAWAVPPPDGCDGPYFPVTALPGPSRP